MSSGDSILLLPLGCALFLGLVGMTGLWWRVSGYVLCGYAALVIARQFSPPLSAIATVLGALPDTGASSADTVVFGTMLAVLFVALRIVYGIIWRPTDAPRREPSGNRGFWARMLGGAICGLVGWTLGAVLVFSPQPMVDASARVPPTYRAGLGHEVVHQTAKIAWSATDLWILSSRTSFSAETDGMLQVTPASGAAPLVVSLTPMVRKTPTRATVPTFTGISTPTPQPKSEGSTPTQILLSTPQGIATANVNLRTGPGTNYPRLGQLVVGETAAVLCRTSDGEWYQVRLSSGDVAWVSAEYLSTESELDVILTAAPDSIPPSPTPAPPTDTLTPDPDETSPSSTATPLS